MICYLGQNSSPFVRRSWIGPGLFLFKTKLLILSKSLNKSVAKLSFPIFLPIF